MRYHEVSMAYHGVTWDFTGGSGFTGASLHLIQVGINKIDHSNINGPVIKEEQPGP